MLFMIPYVAILGEKQVNAWQFFHIIYCAENENNEMHMFA